MSIDLDIADGIATITINRPERLNALDAEHYAALSARFVQARDDQAVRVIIVTGAGDRAFSTGADLKSLVPHPPTLADFMLTQRAPLPNRGLEIWKPIVAAVNGHCLGGGLCLMLGTDIRVAGSAGRFGLTEVRRGLIAGNGGTIRAAAQLPRALAMELLLTGEAIDAETALRWGLVNRVVPPDRVMATAQDYARRIAANAPLAVQAAKEVALRTPGLDDATALRVEQAFLRLLHDTEDRREGTTAFAEKRAPAFAGR